MNSKCLNVVMSDQHQKISLMHVHLPDCFASGLPELELLPETFLLPGVATCMT